MASLSKEDIESILSWVLHAERYDDEDVGLTYTITLPDVHYKNLVSHLEERKKEASDGNV